MIRMGMILSIYVITALCLNFKGSSSIMLKTRSQ